MTTTTTNEKVQKAIRQVESRGYTVAGPERLGGAPGSWQISRFGKVNLASVHIHPDGEDRGVRLFTGKGCYSDWDASEADIAGAFHAGADWVGVQ